MKPGDTGLTRIRKATGYSLAGLRAAWRHESAFRQEIGLLLVMVPAALWLGRDLGESALLIAAGLLVLVVELLNSAIEAAIDRIGHDDHRLSAQAKDLGSAAVFVSLCLAGLVWTAVLADRFFVSPAAAPDSAGSDWYGQPEPCDQISERGAGQDVAGIVQAEHDPGRRDECREGEQEPGELREIGERQGGEADGVQRMARRKAEPVEGWRAATDVGVPNVGPLADQPALERAVDDQADCGAGDHAQGNGCPTWPVEQRHERD